MTQVLQFFERIGQKTLSFFSESGKIYLLARDFFYWSFVAPAVGKRSFRRHAFSEQLVFMGNESFFIILLVSLAVGAVLALQGAYQLKQFGAVLYTGALVSVSIARELGPMVAAIVMAGRVGASITAELGSMKVQEEVDALVTMGIPPIPFLVVPRILAMIVMLPVLTIFFLGIGILGGLFIGVTSLGIDAAQFLDASFSALVPKDILSGLAKSFVFAILVGLISTSKGLGVEGGAEGVGKATTQSVVLSIISIIVADCICTAILINVFP